MKMKSLFLLGLILLSVTANASLRVCEMSNENGSLTRSFSFQTYGSERCTDIGGADYIKGSMYFSSEVDQLIANAKSELTNSLNQKIAFHEARLKKVEAALEEEIVIPESAKEEMKKEIIEELKKEYNLVPKN
jgi:hypothetical protein